MKKNYWIKRAMTTMLAIVLLSVLSINALAYEAIDTTVAPRWVSIYNIDLDMAFSDGVGTVSAAATKKSTSNLIEGTLYLYKCVNGEWVYMGEWYKSKTVGTLGISGDFVCESGITYKSIFVVSAYTSGVPETETVEYCKTCP